MMPRFCPRMFLKTNVSCWIERVDQRPSKLRVAGSSPAAPTIFQQLTRLWGSSKGEEIESLTE